MCTDKIKFPYESFKKKWIIQFYSGKKGPKVHNLLSGPPELIFRREYLFTEECNVESGTLCLLFLPVKSETLVSN